MYYDVDLFSKESGVHGVLFHTVAVTLDIKLMSPLGARKDVRGTPGKAVSLVLITRMVRNKQKVLASVFQLIFGLALKRCCLKGTKTLP